VKATIARAIRVTFGVCFGVAAACSSVTAAVSSAIYPVHGTALAMPSPGIVIAAVDEISGTSATQTRRYHTRTSLRSGETFDAYLDTRTDTLDDVNAAPAFVPGLPNRLITHIAALGDTMPAYQFESQSGRFLRISDFRGKVVLLSFTYSRCPDRAICPAISGKFSYLQRHLDPRRFQLVTITLDPLHDTPAVLKAYGSMFGADATHWSLLTGESAQIKNVIDSFGLDPLETDPGRIIHGDTLAIFDAKGKIAELIPTAGWSPDDVIASAENVAGLASNPLRRFELATVAGIISLCGGNISTGIVVLDSVVFLLGVGILGGLLFWITKHVIIKERY
jgi:cytochrome oxidase Cu insertion factor (SCO1/SenC/PrrC family)